MTITERIDHITHIPQEYLKAKPPAPKSVKIELTGRCNYKCGFCALRMRDKQPLRKDDMKLPFFKRITLERDEAGVEEICLFYLGESLMNPELVQDACIYLKHELQMPYVFLTTNGSLATDEVLIGLMEAGLDSLKFSINATDFVQFKEIMGVKPKLYKKALAAVKRAWEIREEGNYRTKIYASSIQYDGNNKIGCKICWMNILSHTQMKTISYPYIQWVQLPLKEKKSWATGQPPATKDVLVDL